MPHKTNTLATMRHLFVESNALFEKILSQAQDDVFTEGFRMRRVNVLLRIYLVQDDEGGAEIFVV